MLHRWGQLVIAAYHPDTYWVDLAPVQDKEITIHTTGGWTRERMEATIAGMVAGKLWWNRSSRTACLGGMLSGSTSAWCATRPRIRWVS